MMLKDFEGQDVQVYQGNIWNLVDTHAIVIPTNAGWNKNGHAIMGRGLALQAKNKFPIITSLLGEIYQRYHNVLVGFILTRSGDYERFYWVPLNENDVRIFRKNYTESELVKFVELIFVPTKSLNKEEPWLSWKQLSDEAFVRRNVETLSKTVPLTKDKIAVPLLGAGAGGLSRGIVLSILQQLGPTFTVVKI